VRPCWDEKNAYRMLVGKYLGGGGGGTYQEVSLEKPNTVVNEKEISVSV
jgi:hypothetical protein